MSNRLTTSPEIENLAVNSIRILSAEAVQRANSGHPGMPMGAAPLAYTLWMRHLRYNPRNPAWPDRDRFVLSAGHASMLLYSLLYLTGFDLSIEQIERFRQWGSETPGHTEYGRPPGVETTTGPLGQGFGNAVGMALAEARLAAEFNVPGHTVIGHHTYVIASDGDLMEGVQAEAASLAGHLGLGKLIVLYDDNHVTIDGATSLSFSEDVLGRFASYGWHAERIESGDDVDTIDMAIQAAKLDTERPSLIAVRTRIGEGSPHKEGTSAAHGEPLGVEELELTKRNLGWPDVEPFRIPSEVLEHTRRAIERGAELEREWVERVGRFEQEHPAPAAQLRRRLEGALPAGWDEDLPVFEPGAGGVATRVASGTTLNALAARIPELIGGSADLAPSNKTMIQGEGNLERGAYGQRNLHFGVREHAMGAMLNGMALHGGLRPYGGTFLIFSDYMRPSIRLAALMKLPTIYVYTHDSIALGEDGPTHQPIEQLASLRAMPGLTVIRPADANETVAAWQIAIGSDGPVALVLTRQKVPVLTAPGADVAKGAYVLVDSDSAQPDLLLLASGSEVQLAVGARAHLAAEGVDARVVSMPSWELFERQSAQYRASVLPPTVSLRLAVEAGVPMGWRRYVGDHGAVVGIQVYGASAPGPVNMEKFGFSLANVVAHAHDLLTGRRRGMVRTDE